MKESCEISLSMPEEYNLPKVWPFLNPKYRGLSVVRSEGLRAAFPQVSTVQNMISCKSLVSANIERPGLQLLPQTRNIDQKVSRNTNCNKMA